MESVPCIVGALCPKACLIGAKIQSAEVLEAKEASVHEARLAKACVVLRVPRCSRLVPEMLETKVAKVCVVSCVLAWTSQSAGTQGFIVSARSHSAELAKVYVVVCVQSVPKWCKRSNVQKWPKSLLCLVSQSVQVLCPKVCRSCVPKCAGLVSQSVQDWFQSARSHSAIC